MKTARTLLFTVIMMAVQPVHTEASGGHHDAESPEALAAKAHEVAPAAGGHADAGGHGAEHGAGHGGGAKPLPAAHALPADVKHTGHEAPGHGSHAALATKVEEVSDTSGPVLAMDAKTGRSYRSGQMLEAGSQPLAIVDRSNNKIELAPHSVAEFRQDSGFRLLRGSALLESRAETTARTSSARVDYRGRLAISYDYKEQSTSAFVIDGEARMVNPHQEEQSLRLERYRGATMVVGQVIPQLIRQLDVGGVREWLAGYAWPEARMQEMLRGMPAAFTAEERVPAERTHVQSAKLEDYFSTIDTADESNQPDYYERKFRDPDVAIAESKSRTKTGKSLTPEEAALIALPNTKIDLGFELPPEVLTAEEKQRETERLFRARNHRPKRGLASVKDQVKREVSSAKKPEGGDPEIGAVLERLRAIQAKEPVISGLPEGPAGRAPSSTGGGAVPDPVYDFSQNF